MRTKILAVLCCAVALSAGLQLRASPQNDYIVDCVQDETVSPERIITSCKNGIALRHFEHWGWEIIPEAYFNLGIAQERAGNYKDAQGSFVEVIKHELGEAPAWRHFADDSAKLGNSPDLPMQLLDALVRKTPKNTYVLRSACRVRGLLNQQLDVALADCDEAVKLEPKNVWGYYSRCLVRYRKGDFSLAIADCDEAVRLDPKLADPLYIRGLVNMHMGHTELANADIAAAKAINPHIAGECGCYGVTP